MAEIKEMNVRIQLRNGTYQNLQASTLNLMKGEVAVVIDSTNINHLRYKIGDGTKAFKDLPWADGIVTYNDEGSIVVPYSDATLGSKILGLKSGSGVNLVPETDTAGNKTGFVLINSILGSGAVTNVEGTSSADQTFGSIKVTKKDNKGKETSSYEQVLDYGKFNNNITLYNTNKTKSVELNINPDQTNTHLVLYGPKSGQTLATEEYIKDAINNAKITIEAGTGIDVTTSTDGKTYTINNTGILSAKAGDSYIGASTSAGVLTITNKSTLAQGATLGSVKLNGGTDVVVKDYGIFSNNITLKNTAGTKSTEITINPDIPTNTDNVVVYAPAKGGTLALISDIPASTKETVVTAGRGISVSVDTTSSTTKNTYTVTNTGVTAITTGDDLGSIKVTTNGTPADVVVKDYGTFQDIITLKKSGSTKTAEIHVPNWTPEDTGVGSIYQLPVLSQGDGGVIATQQYVTNAIGQIHSFEYIVSTDAATTPKGIVWYNGTTKITGTLEASSSTEYKIYLVPCKHTAEETQKGYDEYLTVKSGSTYSWELIGNTQDVDLSNYVNTLTGTSNSGVITNLTKSGNTLTVTSKSLATASPTATQDHTLQFIDTISQAADGKITATKKSINSNLLVTEGFHTAMNAAGTAAGGATDDTIMVIGAKPSTTPGQFNWDTVNLNAYAKKTDILNPANYYWADQKLTTTAKTDTTPTFASTKFKIGQSVVTVAPNANQLANIALTLPQDAGTLVSTGTILILNGGNASGWDVA